MAHLSRFFCLSGLSGHDKIDWKWGVRTYLILCLLTLKKTLREYDSRKYKFTNCSIIIVRLALLKSNCKSRVKS